MDRRTLLAIALSTAVVFIFYTYLIPRPEPVSRTVSPVEETGRPDPGRTVIGESRPVEDPDVVPETSPAFPDAEASETFFSVETRDIEAEFSNRGGQLTSWVLKEFVGPKTNDRVNLVPAGRGELFLVLDTVEGPVDLRSTLFRSRREDLSDGSVRLVFEAGTPESYQVRKTYTIPASGYLAELDVEILGMSEAEGYRLGWAGGVPQAEKNPKQYDSSHGAIIRVGKGKETLRPDKFKNERTRQVEGAVQWAGVRNKYFMAVMVPPAETSSRVIATGNHERNEVGAQILMPVLQGRAHDEFLLYLGPMDYDALKAIGHGLEEAVDLGWKVFRPLSKLLLILMTWMYQFIPNYGWVIIIISVLTKVLFYPLTRSSIRSMKSMQRLQPQVTALREKYKGDNQKLQMETMALYKKNKVNPVGGCLPILLQMPVFIALYSVLSNSIAMRNAHFFAWITDLSSPDTIAVVGGFAIHVLPIILFVFTVLQQLLTPVTDSRQKMMGYMMPLVTLFIFYGFPAGLNLYWTVNSVVTVAQQWVIHREEPVGVPAPSTA